MVFYVLCAGKHFFRKFLGYAECRWKALHCRRHNSPRAGATLSGLMGADRGLQESDDTEVVPPLEGAAPSAPWNCIDGGVRVAEGWRYGGGWAAATGSSGSA
jgi:hypothetical protein